jgi:hypothetical protein
MKAEPGLDRMNRRERDMTGWRTLASVAMALAVAGPGWGQTYSLVEAPLAGKYLRYQLKMTLEGEIRVLHEGKKVPMKQSARADHVILERILDAAPDGLVRKSAQYYQSARATITVNNDPSERKLRPKRRLLVAQRHQQQGLIYCPAGPLTREEVGLTEHFDTLSLAGLLPGKAVAAGATWKVANPVAQALCNFEGLTSHDLVCKLVRVSGNVAHVSVKGTAVGIDTGALARLNIDAHYEFNLRDRRLTALVWKQKDERDQGPANPTSTAEVTTRLTRTPIEAADELSDVAIVPVPDNFTPPPLMTQVYYRDTEKRYDLIHDRNWQTVGQTDRHLILRLMDRGDFVAQVTITLWTRAQPGKHLSAEEFQKAMAETTGWEAEQELQAGEVPAEEGRWVYRISAMGLLDDVKVMQNFFLVASPQGEQVVLVFTTTPGQAKKLGTRDLDLVGGLSFPATRKGAKKAAKP